MQWAKQVIRMNLVAGVRPSESRMGFRSRGLKHRSSFREYRPRHQVAHRVLGVAGSEVTAGLAPLEA